VPSCAEGGVVGVLPGIIGTLQANEVIKLILGIGKPLIGRLVTFDALDMEFRTFKTRRDPACPVCGANPTITEPIDYEQFCGVPILDAKSVAETKAEVKRTLHGNATGSGPALDARGLPPDYSYDEDWEITPREVKRKLDKKDDFVFIDCRQTNEEAITKIDGSTLIPLQVLGARIGELRGKENDEIIVYCRSGGRSLQFAQILHQHGFKNVKSMAGGVLLWNVDINPGGPQY
jgi:adenylyltransferase/sulfurtransferase